MELSFASSENWGNCDLVTGLVPKNGRTPSQETHASKNMTHQARRGTNELLWTDLRCFT